MEIFRNNDILQKWKYKVDEFNLLIPGEDSITIPNERFRGIEIRKLYEDLFLPIIKITVNLSPDHYYKILQHKKECKFHIKINRYYLNVNDDGEKSINYSYINDIFTLIMDDQTEDMLRSLKEVENKRNYTKKIKETENQLDAVDNIIEFYLYKTSISGLRKNVNNVIKNCNVTDAISYLLSEAGLSNVMMAQPDNKKIYEEFLLPPLSIIKELEFIDYYYGLFKDGSIIFFDSEYSYIIPYNGTCSVNRKRENRNTNIIIPKSTNMSFCNSLCNLKRQGDTDNSYIIADYKTINIENQSISNNYIEGNNTKVVDSNDGTIKMEDSKAVAKDDNYTRVIQNRTENEWLASALSVQSSSKSVVITARLQDFNESDLTPNKRINVIFEDANYTNKYNGTYLISSAVNSFLPDGEDLAISSIIVLKKI